ncbi:YolD-like family protein [Pseudalkalibacillus sp. A8]|uniref:YolD-like family protein n=1 Tax=Pseudalkalibacillus sp. A8 TaxID=3382641 RepID=UPI0038B45BA9
MNKDRGMMKWQGFCLPEHVTLLDGFDRNTIASPRPFLSEEQTEEIERQIIYSLQNNTFVKITIWKEGFFTSMIGKVKKIDPIQKTIRIQGEHDTISTVLFFNISEVKAVKEKWGE